MRILVTGSREFTNQNCVAGALHGAVLNSETGPHVVVHGQCPTGADQIADMFARGPYWSVERHPADWEQHGKAAGFVRNAEMVALGADVCLAFFKQGAGNKGTTHCSDLAEKAGIPVRRFTQE